MQAPRIAMNARATEYVKLYNLGTAVAMRLASSSILTSPTIPLSTLNALLAQVADDIAAWRTEGNRGSHNDLMRLRKNSHLLWQYLKAEAKYVELVAIANAPNDYPAIAKIIISSGFELKKERQKQPPLGVVQNLEFKYSEELNRNQVKVVWDKPLGVISANNVKSYIYFRSTTSDFADAKPIGITSKTVFFDKNDTGGVITYAYFVAAVGARGVIGPISHPITITLLGGI